MFARRIRWSSTKAPGHVPAVREANLTTTSSARNAQGWREIGLPGRWRRRLGRVRQLVIAAGQRELARYYDPEKAPEILRGIVQRPGYINALLTGDAFLSTAWFIWA